jgi:hypothetical protein
MLVPSTRTGWYRKRMMNSETTSDTRRSRDQARRLAAFDASELGSGRP